MAMATREAIPEDFDFDPTFKRQRFIVRFLLGAALNRYPKLPEARLFDSRRPPTRQELIDVAIREGIVWYDEWHHAPMCPSNNWGKQLLPEAPCNCGAERMQIR